MAALATICSTPAEAGPPSPGWPVTALAPTAKLAEVLAKTALLSGPGKAWAQLPFGGVIVDDEGVVERLPPRVARLGAVVEAVA